MWYCADEQGIKRCRHTSSAASPRGVASVLRQHLRTNWSVGMMTGTTVPTKNDHLPDVVPWRALVPSHEPDAMPSPKRPMP